MISELRDKYIAEGLSEDEIVERLLEGGGTNGPSVRQNALSLLISVGASVTPGGGGGNSDSVALQDRRRRNKNVESYLANTLEIDVKKTKAKKKSASGAKVKDAFDIARETSIIAFDGGAQDRSTHQSDVAKEARTLYRSWLTRNPYQTEVVNEDDPKPEKKEKVKRGGGVNQNDLAALQAEFAEVDMEDLEEGAEEGPEDEEEEDDIP